MNFPGNRCNYFMWQRQCMPNLRPCPPNMYFCKPTAMPPPACLGEMRKPMPSMADMMNASYFNYQNCQQAFRHHDNAQKESLQRAYWQQPAVAKRGEQFEASRDLQSTATAEEFVHQLRKEQEKIIKRQCQKMRRKCYEDINTPYPYHLRCLPPGNIPRKCWTSAGVTYNY